MLVIRGGAIGDFILTLPALAALRARYPNARLELLANPQVARLAVAGGLADGARSLDAPELAGFFSRDARLDASCAKFFGGFDLVVSYLFDPDGVFQTNVARGCRGRFIAGPHRPDETADQPASRALLAPLRQLGILDPDPIPRLALGTSERGRAEPACLAVHPGSGSERKNWPEPNWMALARRLVAATDWNLLLIGGEAEGGRLGRMAAALPADRIRLADSLPLEELAALLNGCAGFAGHDSGISHLAAALGLPCVVLWGESNESVWRTLSPEVMVLRDPAGLASLPVTTVFDHLQTHLGRRRVSGA